ncbi:MAG TPA: 4-hydroxy-3-methylbut-2-enyl diphosphate reductase [Gemmataceae bacterium]|jgi:4-hydroxy-3-methylbut-2-enyl diphosphate reductase|nr:4-hydroxy-3-methylbut-2-enyl diphosphate reductase [Gemmataceae bacterium]
MRVIRATAMGMCFGVRDALAAMEQITDPSRATIHGELVHNEQVLGRLRDRGFAMNSETGRRTLPVTEQVIITAHGVSERERQNLVDAGRELIDTTCPLVRRVHEAAQHLQAAGYFVVVIGRPDHVEVQGIVGDLERFAIVPDVAAVRLFGERKLGVVCQSTTPPEEADRVLAAIRATNPTADIRYVDTICRPTRERQQAARELIEQVDALVVVGGRHSNNTRQLARLAEARGIPVSHVQTAADLVADWLEQFDVVGLTAGTSTLESTIDEVERAMLRVGKNRFVPAKR